MHLVRLISGPVLAMALLAAALALAGSAEAQDKNSMGVDLTQSRDSGVSGTATLEDVEGGVEVALQMRNLPEAGVEHINHIHAGGTCADDRAGRTAPVTIPLRTIVAQEDGTGSATTFIRGVSTQELFGQDEERFILLHARTEKGQGVPPGISCADLSPLPSTGGIRPGTSALLAGATILVFGAATGLLVMRRPGG